MSNNNDTHASPAPVFVDLPGDEGVHASPIVDIWYVSCSFKARGRQYHSQVVVVTNVAGPVTTHSYLVDESGDQEPWHEVQHFTDIASSIGAGELDIKLPNLTLSGSLGGFTLQAKLGEDQLNFIVACRSPTIYANGTGMFPFHGGGSYQYSRPDLDVSGTMTIKGAVVEIEGQGWYDRQWASSPEAFAANNGFIWMGLCLSNGDNLSLWNIVAPDGKKYCWATVVQPDTTHIIAPVELSGSQDGSMQRGPWLLRIASLDAELAVSQLPIHNELSFYSGACSVSGAVKSGAVTGFGFVDVVQTS